jgi:hypothetical protein
MRRGCQIRFRESADWYQSDIEENAFVVIVRPAETPVDNTET